MHPRGAVKERRVYAVLERDVQVEHRSPVRPVPTYSAAGKMRHEVERKAPNGLHCSALEQLHLECAPNRCSRAVDPAARRDLDEAQRLQAPIQMGCDDGITLGGAQQFDLARRLNVGQPLVRLPPWRGRRADSMPPMHEHRPRTHRHYPQHSRIVCSLFVLVKCCGTGPFPTRLVAFELEGGRFLNGSNPN